MFDQPVLPTKVERALVLLLRMQLEILTRVGYQVPQALPAKYVAKYRREVQLMLLLLMGNMTLMEFYEEIASMKERKEPEGDDSRGS